MRQVITAIHIAVEVTAFNEDGKIAGRTASDKLPNFTALEAAIPPDVEQWVRAQIGMKGE